MEYSGHGKSSGEFTKGNISKWTYETRIMIEKIVKKNDFILIGSSMGAWISINQFKYFKKQIKGFMGIGSAPEFLERIMWKKFTKKMKSETIKNGIYNLKHGGYEYPITYQLIKDGRQNKVLDKKIALKWLVYLIAAFSIYGLVVFNFGTAVRYKFPFILIVIIGMAYELCLKHGKLILNKESKN